MQGVLKHYLIPVPVCCGLTIAAPQLNAQQSINLDTIVVTGTKTERKLRDVPVRTEVISKQQLEKTHARDLVEALRYQPGVLLQEIHGKSGYQVVMQGVGADRVLVLIDGRPVTPSTGSTVDLSQLSVSDVDHIEVVKGAVSALYGSSAIGGVINIITRKPKQGTRYSLVADVGSWGEKNPGDELDPASRHLSLDASYANPNWQTSINADLRSSDGFDLDPDTYISNGNEGDKANLTLELGFRPNENIELTYKPSFYMEDLSKRIGNYRPGTGFIKKTKTEKVEKHSHSFFYDHGLQNNARFSAYLVTEDFDDDTAQDVNSTRDIVEGKRHAELRFNKAEMQFDMPAGESHFLTMGMALFNNELSQTREGKSETVPDLKHDNIELYFQDDIFIGDRWELLPGLRLQEDSDFGSHAAAKLNAMYTSETGGSGEIRYRFGVGQGYRVPNLKERGYIFDHSSIGYVVLGSEVNQWEDEVEGIIDLDGAAVLDPEESLSLQMGMEIVMEGYYRFEASVFRNEISNLIEKDRYYGSEIETLDYSFYRYLNVDDARTQGLDLSYSKQVSPNLQFDVSYSYLDAIDEQTGKDLVNRPDHQLKVGFNWDMPEWNSDLLLFLSWQSEEYTDSLNTTESPAWHAIDIKYNHKLDKQLTLFAGIDNLTDQHKDPAKGEEDRRPGEGRFIYMGIKLQG